MAPDKRERSADLLQGTLDLLILKAVSLGPLHGYGVLLRIQQISGEELVIQQGSLYPALYRLEHQGAIASEWGESENNRRAKYYRLTDAGRERLAAETGKWNRMAGIIGVILDATPEGL
jgi:PadR family transcriptional regulator, regulatory protein PadR